MRRTQIYLDDEQILELKRRARQSRRRVSAIVREAIDEKLAQPVAPPDFDAALDAVAGIWKDRDDLGSTDAYVRRLRRDDRLRRLATVDTRLRRPD
jgi:hypothetical protein